MRQAGKTGIDGEFASLCARAAACRCCPGMAKRSAVLGPGNGNPAARIMFIAEAPGRLGADRTGIPLHGDRSGDNFERLLAAAGLRREDLFITNAVLCNPRDGRQRNRRPTAREIAACTGFLRDQIELVNPAVIATLGTVALAALARIEAHDLMLARDVCRASAWYGRLLMPLYHPGPRALIRRPLVLQTDDFLRLARLVNDGAWHRSDRENPQSSGA